MFLNWKAQPFASRRIAWHFTSAFLFFTLKDFFSKNKLQKTSFSPKKMTIHFKTGTSIACNAFHLIVYLQKHMYTKFHLSSSNDVFSAAVFRKKHVFPTKSTQNPSKLQVRCWVFYESHACESLAPGRTRYIHFKGSSPSVIGDFVGFPIYRPC